MNRCVFQGSLNNINKIDELFVLYAKLIFFVQ